MTSTTDQPRFSPAQLEALFDRAAQTPAVVTRPGKSDVVILGAETYAALLDQVQSTLVMDADTMDQDPMLSDLADMAASSNLDPGEE